MFDCDGDGFITSSDLHHILKMMTGASLSPAAAETLIQRTVQQTDMDGDGVISVADFKQSMALYPWHTFTVPVKKASREEYFLRLEEANASSASTAPGGAAGLAGQRNRSFANLALLEGLS